MLAIHATSEFEGVDGTSACLTCEAGYQAPFPMAAATANGTSFSAAQRLLKKRSESEIRRSSFPEPCSKEYNRSNEKQVSRYSSG